ncbi:MAG: hypothetical protein U1E62_08160 [Alsobacter sp.]
MAALLGAEVTAHLLSLWPTSTILWYLNIEVFRPFQQISYMVSPLSLMLVPATGVIALAGIWAAIHFARHGRQFSMAVLSHVCLLLSVGIGRGWLHMRSHHAETASLDPGIGLRVSTVSQADIVVLILLGAAIATTLVSHWSYLWDRLGPLWKRAKNFTALANPPGGVGA